MVFQTGLVSVEVILIELVTMEAGAINRTALHQRGEQLITCVAVCGRYVHIYICTYIPCAMQLRVS